MTDFARARQNMVDGQIRPASVTDWRIIDAMRVLDAGRIGIAALAVGLAQGAFEAALRYAMERRAFGRPTCQYQPDKGRSKRGSPSAPKLRASESDGETRLVAKSLA